MAYIVRNWWKFAALAAFSLGITGTTPALARDHDCEAKRAALEQELSYAHQYGNMNRAQGLERALAEVNARCPGASISTPTQPALPVTASPPVAPEGCAARKAALEREIDLARQYGNTRRVQGLERALAEVSTHCTAAGMRADLLEDVTDKKEALSERERELDEAISKGDTERIVRRAQKLEEAREELAAAKARLAALPQ